MKNLDWLKMPERATIKVGSGDYVPKDKAPPQSSVVVKIDGKVIFDMVNGTTRPDDIKPGDNP
jgi:hypothetical protein